MIITNRSLSLAVCPSEADQLDRALKLSRRLSIPLVQDSSSEKYAFLLLCSSGGLALKQTGTDQPGPIMTSFTSGPMTYRIKHGGGRGQALARAVGLKKGWQPSVIDATAGLGRDGFVLACLGCRVHMLERSPILSALLEDALHRAQHIGQLSEIIEKRIKFTQADSIGFLQRLPGENFPDVIYLDPMYPERTKSSLVKKEMRILREMAGDDRDAEELLTVGLSRVRNRVVVKRPRLAPALGGAMPSHKITGKTCRFDVYLI